MSNTLILRPTSYTAATVSTYSSQSDLQNAYDSDDSTYATTKASTKNSGGLATNGSAAGTVTIYYDFDLSPIPSGSKIISATLYGKGGYSSSSGKTSGGTTSISRSASRYLGLYDNRTAINSSVISITHTLASPDYKSSAFTDSQIASWFASANPSVRLYNYVRMVNRGTTSVTITAAMYTTINLYDIYVEVEYESSGLIARNKTQNGWVQNTINVRVGNEIKKPTKGYVKVNGLWRPIK